MSANPMEVIKEKDQKLFGAIANNYELAFADGEISKKNKLLIALAIDSVIKAENGVKVLALQAIENGATKEEIHEVLRIVNFICGTYLYKLSVKLEKQNLPINA